MSEPHSAWGLVRVANGPHRGHIEHTHGSHNYTICSCGLHRPWACWSIVLTDEPIPPCPQCAYDEQHQRWRLRSVLDALADPSR